MPHVIEKAGIFGNPLVICLDVVSPLCTISPSAGIFSVLGRSQSRKKGKRITKKKKVSRTADRWMTFACFDYVFIEHQTRRFYCIFSFCPFILFVFLIFLNSSYFTAWISLHFLVSFLTCIVLPWAQRVSSGVFVCHVIPVPVGIVMDYDINSCYL